MFVGEASEMGKVAFCFFDSETMRVSGRNHWMPKANLEKHLNRNPLHLQNQPAKYHMFPYMSFYGHVDCIILLSEHQGSRECVVYTLSCCALFAFCTLPRLANL